MRSAELFWPPYPWRAGFCITDDTDAATLESVRAVYDLLAGLGLKTTKTVWVSAPSEPCGIPALPDSIQRGITCDDPDYLEYCERLAALGFEISLHGATAGNNRRERTAAGLEFLERHFGRAGTWIGHAKNAENPYWHERVAPRGPAQALLGLASRYRCSGEDPASPYFWGDLCLEHVEQIRLFRTRDIDTLAANPSMPYHDPEKPYVANWFSATKRSFRDCTSAEALARLVAAGGLCVLYQYLHRYYDPAAGGARPAFRAGAERLASTAGVWVDTTSAIMRRRRRVFGVFAGVRERELWLANAGTETVSGLHLELPSGVELRAPGPGVRTEGSHVRLPDLTPGDMVRLELDAAVTLRGARMAALDRDGRGSLAFGFGHVDLNAGPTAWIRDGRAPLAPARCEAVFDRGYERLRPFSRASLGELYGLLAGQLGIIGHEVVFKRRSLDSRRFLDTSREILLEDQDVW